jgi:mono/diheme cytochrome c family protein
MKSGQEPSSDGAPAAQQAQVLVPQNLTLTEQKGQVAFTENCAVCHGQNALGTEQGPPFVHNIYNPGHHSDESFFLAAQRGVRAHHWPYGDMPPQPQVTASEVAAIIAYVRAVQAANGIITRPHTM